MFSLGSTNTYHLYRGSCDMRKSFNGLSGLVRSELGRDPTGGEVFIFVNRRRTHIKLLHWPDLVMMIEGIRVERSVQLPRYEVVKNGEKT